MEFLRVKEAMTKGAVSCQEETTVKNVAKLMVDKDIRSAVVLNKIGKPVGIVTGGDIVKAMAKSLKPETPVSNIISKGLISIDSKSNIIEASDIMNDKNIKRLVVVEKGNVVGILSVHDVLKYYPRYLSEFSKTMGKLDKIIARL